MPTYIESTSHQGPTSERGILFPGNLARYPGYSNVSGRKLLLLCLPDDSALEIYKEPNSTEFGDDGDLLDPEETLRQAEKIASVLHEQEITLYVGENDELDQINLTLTHYSVFHPS